MSVEGEGRMPEIDQTRCAGCGRCVAACRRRLISLEVSGFRKFAVLASPGSCAGCLACLAACPVRAVTAPDPGSDAR